MSSSLSSSQWRAIILNPKMLVCVLTGFSSGLPLYLLFNLVPAWLKTEGLSLKTIGAITLIQFPYTWKFLWSPLVDRYALPFLGRRRGWMLVTQGILLVSMGMLGQFAPQSQIKNVIVLMTWIAFCSSTLDIVLDAFRRELLTDKELGLGNGIHVNAYKIAGLVPGSLSLILADHWPWHIVFWVTAGFMLPGIFMTLWVPEPKKAAQSPRTLRAAVIEPFQEFFNRHGWQSACWVLAFIFFYKLGDSLCTALATPFYLEMGYTKTEIGLIAKNAGLWPSVFGGIVGGIWMVKMGINRALWVFGIVQLAAILGFAWLAWLGPNVPESLLAVCSWLNADTAHDVARRIVLSIVIGLEALGVGLGSAAFVAYMARTTHPAYTATQLALFTSLMAVPRTFINASAGWLVEGMGWFHFFLLCFLLGLPGMALLLKVAPWGEDPQEQAAP